jgi:hypothetical protein
MTEMLDVERLVRGAMRRTELEDFGPAPWRDGLEVLCESLNGESRLNGTGRAVLAARLGRTLQQRLMATDWFARHPEIAEVPIDGPLAVTGLPRTGTTALSNLLGTDPATRAPRVWECEQPCPPPDAGVGDADPRIAECQAGIDGLHDIAPVLRILHDDEATSVAEHMELLSMTFRTYHYSGMAEVSGYLEWWMAQDALPAYEFHRRMLQLLGWRWGPSRWHIRNPPDLFALPALVETYPGVRIVWTHRDPVAVMASVCELIAVVREMCSDHVDRHELGRRELEVWGTAMDRALAARNELGEDRFVDVWHRDFVVDPVASVAAVYGEVGWEFTQEAEAGARRWVADHERTKFGTHDPQLADFGLDRDQVRERFAAYCERFEV